MELTQTQLKNLQTLSVNSSTLKAENLAVGQQVQAKVTDINTQTGQVTLQINNKTANNNASTTASNTASTTVSVTVKNPLSTSLAPGQTLQLTVTQVSTDKIVLQPQPALIEKVVDQKLLQEALRQALPKQQPISNALIELKSLLTTHSQNKTAPLPNNITQLIKAILNKIPTPTLLSTPTGVKQAIQQSGVFLEASLNTSIKNTTNASFKKNQQDAMILNPRNKIEEITKEKTNSNNTQIIQTKNIINNDTKALLLNLKSSLIKEQNLPVKINNVSQESLKASQYTNSPQVASKTLIQDKFEVLKTNNDVLTKALVNNIVITDKNIRIDTLIKQQYEQILQLKTTEEKNTALKKVLNEYIIEKKISSDQILNNQQLSNQLEKNNLSDKQILQIINIIFSRKLNKKTNTTSTPLTTPQTAQPKNNSTPTTQASTVKVPQGYANKNNIPLNDLSLTATKSQHISEASAPKINNLMDLIETLVKQVDSAISRTQVHQLNALQDQESGKLAMSLEIPVNDEDNLHLVKLHIEKETKESEELESVVTVNLAVDLDKIGPVYARIILINDDTSVVLWAERDDTFSMVQENINKLHTKLEKSGLKANNITCHQGQPPQAQFIKTDNNSSLLDVRA